MNLDSLDEVTTLRNHRKLAIGLRDGARTGSLGDFNVWFQGQKFDVFSIISAEPVRSAIIVACEEFVIDIDEKLAKLGVRPSDPMKRSEATIDDWKRSAEMFSRAWLRELGGKLVPKSHFIDALVLTTQRMREKADQSVAPLTPPQREPGQ